jgi:hypothetical protein
MRHRATFEQQYETEVFWRSIQDRESYSKQEWRHCIGDELIDWRDLGEESNKEGS